MYACNGGLLCSFSFLAEVHAVEWLAVSMSERRATLENGVKEARGRAFLARRAHSKK